MRRCIPLTFLLLAPLACDPTAHHDDAELALEDDDELEAETPSWRNGKDDGCTLYSSPANNTVKAQGCSGETNLIPPVDITPFKDLHKSAAASMCQSMGTQIEGDGDSRCRNECQAIGKQLDLTAVGGTCFTHGPITVGGPSPTACPGGKSGWQAQTDSTVTCGCACL